MVGYENCGFRLSKTSNSLIQSELLYLRGKNADVRNDAPYKDRTKKKSSATCQ